MKRPKTKFAILGLIMLFSFPVSSNISLRLITLTPQVDFYLSLAGMILGLIGIIIIT